MEFQAIKIIISLIILLFLVSVANAATRIGNIRFVGNEKTRESLLRREMHITEGDEIDLRKIEKSIQGIMDLGLYRNVGYYLQEDYKYGADTEEPEAELVVVIEEKIYLLVLPRIRMEDNYLRLGVQLRWDNLHGLNHAIRLTAERMGEREGVTEFRKRFRYKYPNVLNSEFDMKIKITSENYIEENAANILQNQLNQSFDITAVKWLNREGRKYGPYARLGAGYVGRVYEDISSGLTVDEVEAINVTAGYGYRKVHEHLYNRSGKDFGYKVDISDERFGSATEYVQQILFYKSYYRFKSRPNDNLNVQTVIGHSTDDVLGDRAFTLDYRNDLRGYDRDRFQGNSMLLVNMEYLTAYDPYPIVRYVYFLDLGNTYDEIELMFHRPLHIGVGGGIRWKIPAFVRLDLRLDFGYGVTDREWYTSVGTRYMF